MKICTVIGARPQFIKAAVVSRAICASKSNIIEVIVHTGQHYDYEMSQVFFDQLNIPRPDYHLNVGSGLHGGQTGKMLTGIEDVLIKEKPDWVLVYGDTNSTLAGALAAAKLHIKIAHVEAGLRSFNRKMPEEINRILTDHVSTILFAPTPTAIKNLKDEGISNGVSLVPDVMEEALFTSLPIAEAISGILKKLELTERKYALATIHRAENTDDTSRLKDILLSLIKISEEVPVVLPLHPRTRAIIASNHELLALNPERLVNFNIIDPVSYLDMIMLEAHAKVILTDSGGMQKEAMWLQVPCITMRDETEWVETVESGWNNVCGADLKNILNCYKRTLTNGFNEGVAQRGVFPNAGKIILDIMSSIDSDNKELRDD